MMIGFTNAPFNMLVSSHRITTQHVLGNAYSSPFHVFLMKPSRPDPFLYAS
ncbi:hypothetical protein BMS3Bbin04_02101 [bacterium BMS3Bbin04]|nr:hypothetical protein BMS3Bbin04_02101 [bacterium BMS3Bbin04]